MKDEIIERERHITMTEDNGEEVEYVVLYQDETGLPVNIYVPLDKKIEPLMEDSCIAVDNQIV